MHILSKRTCRGRFCSHKCFCPLLLQLLLLLIIQKSGHTAPPSEHPSNVPCPTPSNLIRLIPHLLRHRPPRRIQLPFDQCDCLPMVFIRPPQLDCRILRHRACLQQTGRPHKVHAGFVSDSRMFTTVQHGIVQLSNYKGHPHSIPHQNPVFHQVRYHDEPYFQAKSKWDLDCFKIGSPPQIVAIN